MYIYVIAEAHDWVFLALKKLQTNTTLPVSQNQLFYYQQILYPFKDNPLEQTYCKF